VRSKNHTPDSNCEDEEEPLSIIQAELSLAPLVIPFIIAELALGSLRERTKTLALLDLLPQVRVARPNELRLMIEARRLYNLGIGLTDAHLIASVLVDAPRLLWTRDRRLRRVAENLSIHGGLT